MKDRACCVLEVAPIRARPDDSAEQVTQALQGELLLVEERAAGWVRVRTAYDYPGWIRSDALTAGVADTGWMPPRRDGDPLIEARAFLASPYLWGGLTERGIDCSGLVHMAYRRLGLLVPRDADQQEAAGMEIAEADLRPGDLVTYGDERETTHIAFWLGHGRILHATEREGVDGVIEEPEPDDLRTKRRRFVRLES